MAHKLREAITAQHLPTSQLSGAVEVDGAYFGGHVKQENEKKDRKDRRLAEEQTGKRQSLVVIRERGPSAGSCHCCGQRSRCDPLDPQVCGGWLNSACGRSAGLGQASCPFRREANQPLRCVQQGWCMHQSS